jgi:hypothetical protein
MNMIGRPPSPPSQLLEKIGEWEKAAEKAARKAEKKKKGDKNVDPPKVHDKQLTAFEAAAAADVATGRLSKTAAQNIIGDFMAEHEATKKAAKHYGQMVENNGYPRTKDDRISIIEGS